MKYILTLFFIFSFINTLEARVITDKAIIHHTASPDWTTVADIDNWHKENGWDGIGYHFVILVNGDIKEGRDINKHGSHAYGRNKYVGIALVGYSKFSKEQIKSLVKLLKDLNVKEIEGHHKDCPSNGINLKKIIQLVKDK